MTVALDSRARRALALLEEWPAVRTTQASCRRGVGVAVGAREVLHLHSDRDAELCLTRPTIDRMRAALADTGQVVFGPSEDWIGVRLESEADIDLLLALLSVAIKTCDPGQAVTRCSAPADHAGRSRGICNKPRSEAHS
ncbi:MULTISPECIES: luciferase family protein [Nonomuraea]|uniref:Luciferase family protein n=1 Tax=Nonomuraea mangrovi TaxID=2316207 RepID=A0ABW4SYZ1_9ACTN